MEAREDLSFGWQAAVFATALVAIFSRLPGAFLHPQFFAEDGWVWYQQAYNLHWLRSLGIAQAGYLQTLPRLVAGVTLLLPMQWAPLIMNAGWGCHPGSSSDGTAFTTLHAVGAAAGPHGHGSPLHCDSRRA